MAPVGGRSAGLIACMALIAAMTASAAPAFATVSFTTGTTYPSGGDSPITVAVADLDGDSHQDLIVGNLGSPNVSVLLGDGNAGFSSPTSFASDGYSSLAVGDFNGDSRPDVVGTVASGDRVEVLLNLGGGDLGPAAGFATGPFPFDVAVGDFNRDTKLDLVTADNMSSNVSVLLGNGSGGFGPHVDFPVGSGRPWAVGVGDFNDDSKLDLAVYRSVGVSVLTGDGAGGFSSPTTIPLDPGTSSNGSLAVGDFNEDGADDFAVSHGPDAICCQTPPGNTWVFLSDGAGGLSDPLYQPLGGVLLAGDFDSDFDLDLVVSWEQYFAKVLAGNGSGGFSDDGLSYGPAAFPAAGSFSDDSLPDLVAPRYRSDEVLVLYNTTPNYVRPRGATPLRASLVPAFGQCLSPSKTHGPPLASPSCNPPVQASGVATVGAPDANGAPVNSIGSVVLSVKLGQPGPPNDSDVNLTASVTDVRCRTSGATCGLVNAVGGADYAGELQATARVRLTDRLNGPTQIGTVSDFSIPATIPCTATPGTSTGATCAVTTTYNALTPGLVVDGARAIWGLGQIQVIDGGPDGDVDTASGNTLFAVQGVFVP